MSKRSRLGNHLEVLTGEIGWATIHDIYEGLMKQFTKKPFKRLILVIASQGGEVDASWGLYALLNAMPFEIDTVACGRVFSAATVIYMVGKERYALPDSIFLFHPTTHEGYTKGECTTYDLEEAIKGSFIDREHFAKVIANKTKCNKEFLAGIVKPTGSVYLNTTQALQYGIVTKIINKLADV